MHLLIKGVENMLLSHDPLATPYSIFLSDLPVAVTAGPDDAAILHVPRRSYDDEDDVNDECCPTFFEYTDSSIAQSSGSETSLSSSGSAPSVDADALDDEEDVPSVDADALDDEEDIGYFFEDDRDDDKKEDSGIQVAADRGSEHAHDAGDDDVLSALSSVHDCTLDHSAGAPDIAAARNGGDARGETRGGAGTPRALLTDNDWRQEGLRLCCLGNTQYSLGQFAEAVDNYKRALAIARRVGDRQERECTYQSKGDFEELGDDPEAAEGKAWAETDANDDPRAYADDDDGTRKVERRQSPRWWRWCCTMG